MLNLVSELLVILATGLAAALACRRMQIPSLVGYLLAGVLIGKGVLGWVTDEGHEIAHLAEAGVFFLLFSIGLEFSLGELWRLGRNILIGGGAQMLLVVAPVGALLSYSGMAWQPAVLVATAVSFSSTVLVFKTLSEWGHSIRPHGQRAIGVLLFQDAALVPLLLVVPLLTTTGADIEAAQYLTLSFVSLSFIVCVVLLQKLLALWLIPRFASYRSPELIVLFTLCVLGGVTFAAWSIGLPPAIGAFAAGLIFSGNRWSHQIDSLILPFRETFSAVFFVSLGLLFEPRFVLEEPLIMAGSLAALLAIKGTAATLALRLTGLTWKSATGMGIGLAHVGEFAFVLVLLGAESGVLGDTDYQRFSTLAIASLILTPMLLKFGLRRVHEADRKTGPTVTVHQKAAFLNQAIVIGAGPVGRGVASHLQTSGHRTCILDLSPVNLHSFAQQGFHTVAGDATNSSLLELADVSEADWVVVCLPDDLTARRVVKAIRIRNSRCFILVRCRFESNVPKMRKAGADTAISEETEVCQSLLRSIPKTQTSIAPFSLDPQKQTHLTPACLIPEGANQCHKLDETQSKSAQAAS
ncbi:MAG: cation:proton antiporter [Rhodopirellula sp.]|nr:cation:proton antiporter [Rhodopirellula sp.]